MTKWNTAPDSQPGAQILRKPGASGKPGLSILSVTADNGRYFNYESFAIRERLTAVTEYYPRDCRGYAGKAPNDFLLPLKMTFDGLYRHSHSQPNMLTVGLHSRLPGHPGRSEAVRQFIDYVLEHRDVSFMTRAAIATRSLTENRQVGLKPRKIGQIFH